MTSTADSAAQFDLADHQREVRSMVRDFAAQRIAPNAADWDRGHVFDRSLYAELAELGLMGVCVPEEYDGAGMDFLSYVLVVEELSRADAGVGVTMAVHTSASTLPILHWGTDEQK
ncbi:MAG: acyl-CoA dehydrogenase family protein, partial [Thermoleophilia bacterium]|nr:acyl-CoA dehydrogenase family protein [Thermoleophilia bacterium]